MKYFINIFLTLILVFGFFACEENDPKGYNGNDAVYFQTNASNWSEIKDSIEYSFAGKVADVDTVKLLVKLMGNVVNYDRKITPYIVSEKTTAQEGLHYESLKGSYILKADEMEAIVPLVVYNRDARLDEQSFSVTIALKPSDELSLGITKRTQVTVIISNILKKPEYFDRFYLNYYFGPYTRSKHEMMIQIVGKDFPETADEMNANFSFWQEACNYFNNYLKDNYPVYGSDGNVIEPWK